MSPLQKKVKNVVIKKRRSTHSARNKHYVKKLLRRPPFFPVSSGTLGISLIHALMVVGIPFLAHATLGAYSRTLEVDTSALVVLRYGNVRGRGLAGCRGDKSG